MSPHKLKACDICASIKQVCERGANGSSECCERCARLSLKCTITRIHKPMGRPRKIRNNTNSTQVAGLSSLPPTSSATGFSTTPEDDFFNFLDEFLDFGSDNGASDFMSLSPCSTGSGSAGPNKKRKFHNSNTNTTLRICRSRRSSSGCGTCKRRRKKCNEAYPVCSECSRLGLTCERRAASPRNLPSNASSPCSPSSPESPSSYSPTSSSSVPFHILSAFANFSSQEQHLLQHYVVVVSRSLSVVPDEISPFLYLFIPMVVVQPTMRKGLLSLSASHIRRHQDRYHGVMKKYQAETLKEALVLVNQNTPESVTEGLAAILLLCVQEICDGRSPRWSRHLEAAANIVNTHGGPHVFPDSVRFLIEAIAYFDATATLSFSRSALLDQEFYLPHRIHCSNSQQRPHIAAHALFGTAHELFCIISKISKLSESRFTRYSSAANEALFNSRAEELELALQQWIPDKCVPPVSDPDLPQKTTAAAISIQWAAMMRLHQLSVGYDIAHPKVRVAVTNILATIDTIPEGDLIESMLVFPMTMAGVGAVTPEERTAVRSRFDSMKGSVGFGNVWDAHRIVEMLWRRRDEDNDTRVRWEDLVEEDGGTLIMS